jgi:hypothetical protein
MSCAATTELLESKLEISKAVRRIVTDKVGFGEIAIDLLQARFWPINSLEIKSVCVRSYRDRGFSRDQPTRSANSEAALGSA